MALQSAPAYSGFRSHQIGQAYNEAAFRYFLGVDRLRAERSRRPLILALASLREAPGRSALLTHDTAAVIFDGLAASVREVDFVGWFREGRVAGAVLAQGAGAADERAAISKRILVTLRTSLPRDRSANVHLRVVRLGRGLQ
jgi:hypothetical protein